MCATRRISDWPTGRRVRSRSDAADQLLGSGGKRGGGMEGGTGGGGRSRHGKGREDSEDGSPRRRKHGEFLRDPATRSSEKPTGQGRGSILSPSTRVKMREEGDQREGVVGRQKRRKKGREGAWSTVQPIAITDHSSASSSYICIRTKARAHTPLLPLSPSSFAHPHHHSPGSHYDRHAIQPHRHTHTHTLAQTQHNSLTSAGSRESGPSSTRSMDLWRFDGRQRASTARRSASSCVCCARITLCKCAMSTLYVYCESV